MLRFRLMEKQDGEQINRLFKVNFGAIRTLKEWSWKFYDNPHGSSIVVVAESAGKIIGQYALIPRKIKCFGSIKTACQEVDLMVDPEFRSRKLFKDLGLETYNYARSKNVEFTFGFPNNRSYPVGSRTLGWRGLAKIPLMTLPINLSKFFAFHRKNESSGIFLKYLAACWIKINALLKMKPSKSITIHRLWNTHWSNELFELENGKHFHFIRDDSFMCWRYDQCPSTNYEYITGYSNDRLVALAVLAKVNEYEAYVVEYWNKSRYKDIDRQLMAAIVQRCREYDVALLRTWAIEKSQNEKLLDRLGFIGRDSQLLFNIKSFQTPEVNRLLWDANRWYITAGDSDCV